VRSEERIKVKTSTIIASLTVLLLATNAVPGFADDDAGIKYTLQAATGSVPAGQSPGLRLSVTNNSGAPVLHVLEPTAYAVTIDGPDGHDIWFFQEQFMPMGLRLQSGQTSYLFGGSTRYQYPDTIYFEHAGVYHIRYCDNWKIDGHWKKICSNNLEVHVGVGNADNGTQ
jgi:hypothetical protein